MKMPKIMRPEIEVEYVGLKGFFAALLAICKVGIKRVHVDCQIKTLFNGNGGTVKRYYFYILPKYKLKKVQKIENWVIEESEVDTE